MNVCSYECSFICFVKGVRWRPLLSEVLTYGQSEVCYASEVFAKAKVKFRLWRSDNQACVSLCLHKRGTRRLLCSQKIYDFLRCESTESGRFQRAKSICLLRRRDMLAARAWKNVCGVGRKSTAGVNPHPTF